MFFTYKGQHIERVTKDNGVKFWFIRSVARIVFKTKAEAMAHADQL